MADLTNARQRNISRMVCKAATARRQSCPECCSPADRTSIRERIVGSNSGHNDGRRADAVECGCGRVGKIVNGESNGVVPRISFRHVVSSCQTRTGRDSKMNGACAGLYPCTSVMNGGADAVGASGRGMDNVARNAGRAQWKVSKVNNLKMSMVCNAGRVGIVEKGLNETGV